MSSPKTAPGFLRRFLPVLALGAGGATGLLAMPPAIDPAALPPELRELPDATRRLLLLVNPLVLVAVAAAVGAGLAHRAGLRSLAAGTAVVASWRSLGRSLLRASVLGLLLAAAISAADAALAPWLGETWLELVARAEARPALPALVGGVLYGGLAEEVMLRWGLMSLLAWLAMRAAGPARGPAGSTAAGAGGASLRPTAAWLAIAIAALAFGAAHLPAVAAAVELTPALVARTIALNALGGLAYGWLFWRHGLEHAFAAHASTHVGFFVLKVL
ncbi:CPBP family glutamic-type intramembrane protease [Burkholderiaceae bacterium FT117]|uniref:CPBP family glutamic-type intramembrane protease n=1 Tax=Zeimonas sediminis TaxID=2944268 RepID=UPI002342CE55|nr:CPBP family glutamic-type intramembrane protease [Zeimonas sediminis]MCM5571012.1 CPBP family glutamic-type intramembrane protease [Zeimonas sediminis]